MRSITKISTTIFCLFTLLLAGCGGKQHTSAITGVSYVGASVSNLDDTVSLYTQSADLKNVQNLTISGVKSFNKMMGQDNVSIATTMLRSSNAQVRYMQFAEKTALGQATKAVPVNGPGIAHLCFQVNGKTETYQKFLKHGAQHIGGIDMVQINPRRPVEYGYVNDKDGLIVEIEHVDISQLDLDVPPKNDYRIRHISLATPNIKRATKFYAQILGEEKPRKLGRFRSFGNEAMDNISGLTGSKVKMAWLQLRNLEIEIIQYTSHPTELPAQPRALDAPGYNMIVFDVSDLDAAKEQFIDAGGTIISDSESLDGGQIMFGRDPDGNLIGLQLPAKDSVVSSHQFLDNGI